MPGMFGNPMGASGSRLRGGDIRDELERGVLGPIHFPRVVMPQFDLPPAEAAPSPTIQPQRSGANRIIGIIGDALAGAAGQPGMYAQNNYARQREERRRAEIEAQYERQRSDSWADFVRKAEYERANPKPVNNDTVADYNFIASQLGPEEANQYLRNRADPIVNIPLPGGDVYIGPRSGMGTLGGGASSAPAPAARAPESILGSGASNGFISPEEASTITASLGPNGQAAFETWRRNNGVQVGKRLANGQMAYFVNGKWYDNPEGR